MAELLVNGASVVLALAGRADRLSVFLRKQASAPFSYGLSDCALMPADWCASECGIDPAASLRGKYGTETEWQKLASDAGGLSSLWDRLGREAGLVETGQPALADIGLVEIADFGIFGAIKMANRWIVKLDRGITASSRFKMVAAWRVPA